MRAVRYDGQSVYVDQGSPDPTPGDADALIRPTLSAVDAIDLSIVRGELRYEGIIGRRFVGVVEDAPGPRGASWIGRRVVATPSIVDADSEYARRGIGAHDPDRRMVGAHGHDGAMADRIVVPVNTLTAVPDELEDERAVFVIPVARALHAARLVRVEGRAFITVLGDTPDALICAQVMSRLNASVRVLGTDHAALALCERWGVKHRPQHEAGRRQDQDVVVDGVCTPESVELACALCRPRGSVILKPESPPFPGSPHPALAGVDLSPALINEIELIPALAHSVAEAVALLASGAIDTGPLVGRRFALVDAVGALRAASDPGAMTMLVAA
ncbi:MAG: alcohol dehydrogenase [Phycisphaeraceae bacterium]|nr:MAG: alcohol dehydrogenase [Phycisphaeraceae bacterium]